MHQSSRCPKVLPESFTYVNQKVRRRGMTSFRVTVSDISPEGCKVELVERPSVDEHVLLKFDGIEAIDSEVCWVEGFTAGLKFERPIHPAVFDLMVARLK